MSETITLRIEGKQVKVDRSFLEMSPEQQEATVNEIAAQIGAKPAREGGVMADINRGIADAAGGLVDLINPFDQPHSLNPFPGGTGSAREGLADLMERGGIAVDRGEAEGFAENFARGVGQSAGAIVPAAAATRALSTAGGVIGQVADDATRALASGRGMSAEMLAGGVSEGARSAVEERGGPQWAQDLAGVVAPAVALPAAAAVTQGAARYAPSAIGARQISRSAAAAMAPYTRSGATEVARQRMQSLAGGAERARELGGMVKDDLPFGATPAQSTGDPNLLALEQMAAAQDPNLRSRLEARRQASFESGREAVAAEGGDVSDAQSFLSERHRAFTKRLQSRADQAMQDADRRIADLGGNRTPADNSVIVREEIDKALRQATQEERDLWDKVPVTARVGLYNAKSTAERLAQETARAQSADMPEVVRRLLLSPEGLQPAESVREVYGLYSELRRVARSAMAGNDQNRNRARIADEIANAILNDLGAVDGSTEVGRAINVAREFSAAKHETFDRGAVGRLLKRTLDGDGRIEPEMSLESTVGRGGTIGAVSARQIEAAAPQAQEPIVDFLRDRFQSAAVGADGRFTEASARKFLKDNTDLLSRYPGLRSEVAAAVRSRDDAVAFSNRIGARIKAIEDSKQSSIARFLNAPADQAARSITESRDPATAARRLANAARKDDTGAALAGLKGAFADQLISKGGVSGEFSGRALSQALADRRMRSAMSQVFSPEEIGRLQRIAKVMSNVEASTGQTPFIGDNLSGARANRLIEYMARIVAAREGAAMGGNMGGSLQTAQMASSRVKEIVNNLTRDRASQILAAAVEDPALFRSLLIDERSVQLEKRVLPRLAPYLIGATSATLTE